MNQSQGIVNFLYKAAESDEYGKYLRNAGIGAGIGAAGGAVLGKGDDTTRNALLGALAGATLGTGYTAAEPEIDSLANSIFRTSASPVTSGIGFDRSE